MNEVRSLRVLGRKQIEWPYADATGYLRELFPGREIHPTVVAAWNIAHCYYIDVWGVPENLIAEIVYHGDENDKNSIDKFGNRL